MLHIKICGNRTVHDIALAINAGADAVGIICGVRHVSEDALAPGVAAVLLASVPPQITAVLVTHFKTAREVLALHRFVPAETIQLHGDVPVSEIKKIRKALPDAWLIKAVGVTGEEAIKTARQYVPHVNALVLDSRTKTRIGGTGTVHDWSVSRRIVEAISKPVILAGGLNPENLAAALKAVGPAAVDVNSGVESANGEKDPARVAAFIRIARSRAGAPV